MWSNQQNDSLILGDANGTHIDITVDPPQELKNAGYTEAIIFYDSTATKYVALVADNNGDMLSYRWDGNNLTQIISLDNLNADLEGTLGANIVNSLQLAAEAVTTEKIAVAAITSAVIAAGAITTTRIADGAITTPKITAGAITAAVIAAGTITSTQIAAGTITGTNIAATTITAANIVSGTITSTQLAANSIIAGKIAAGAIDGMTITGALLRTAASGVRIEVTNNPPSAIQSAGYTEAILFWDSTGTHYIALCANNSGDLVVLQDPAIKLIDIGGTFNLSTFYSDIWLYGILNPGASDSPFGISVTDNSASNAQNESILSGSTYNTTNRPTLTFFGRSPDNTQLSVIELFADLVRLRAGTKVEDVNGNPFRVSNCGFFSGVTTSGGIVTINHGLSAKPNGVLITPYQSAIGYLVKPLITGVTTTQIQIAFYNSTNGALLGGNPVEFYWDAKI